MTKSTWRSAGRPYGLYPDCAALFELPRRVYAQIMQDNSMRRKPYRVSEVKIRKIIATMPEFQ